MKTLFRPWLTALAGCVISLTCTHLARAGTVDWSGLGAVLTKADDATLCPAGSLVRLGYFNLTDAELMANTNTVAALDSAFVELDAAAVGDGVMGLAGYWTASFTGDFSTTYAAFGGRNIYFWALDAATTGAASQHGIYRFINTYPTDTPIPGQESVDLEQLFLGQATVLVGALGTTDGAGPHVNMATIAGGPPPAPVANFSAEPLVVTVGNSVNFTDLSTGLITDYAWTFGDGGSSTLANPSHTYAAEGVYPVSLMVTGPGGSSSTNFPGLVHVVAGSGPVIVTDPFVTNAVLQVGNVHVAVAGEPAVFRALAIDPNDDPVSYEWDFGDGAEADGPVVSHTYSSCESYTVTLEVTDGTTTNETSFVVAVPCAMDVSKLQLKTKLTKPDADSAKVTALLDLPADTEFAGRTLVVDVGGARDTYVIDEKGTGGVGALSKCKLKFDSKSGRWQFTTTLKGGTWSDDWEAFGLVDAEVAKPGVTVNVPVILLIDTEALMDEPALIYTAKQGKSGSAKK